MAPNEYFVLPKFAFSTGRGVAGVNLKPYDLDVGIRHQREPPGCVARIVGLKTFGNDSTE